MPAFCYDKIINIGSCRGDFKQYDETARLQVEKPKQFTTDKMYICIDEILSGLGQMYAAYEQFTKNINKQGEGTAAYVSECIKNYCI